MRDILLIMMLPLSMFLGWFLSEEMNKGVVHTTSDCIAQKRDEWRKNNRYPGNGEWRRFRDLCWTEMGATLNSVEDL